MKMAGLIFPADYIRDGKTNKGIPRPLSVSFLFRTSGNITVKLARLRYPMISLRTYNVKG